MSSSASASSYWRVAGMSYLKYANLCADMVRSSLKEPQRTKAKLREAIYYRAAVWKDGKPEKQGAFLHLCLPYFLHLIPVPLTMLVARMLCCTAHSRRLQQRARSSERDRWMLIWYFGVHSHCGHDG